MKALDQEALLSSKGRLNYPFRGHSNYPFHGRSNFRSTTLEENIRPYQGVDSRNLSNSNESVVRPNCFNTRSRLFHSPRGRAPFRGRQLSAHRGQHPTQRGHFPSHRGQPSSISKPHTQHHRGTSQATHFRGIPSAWLQECRGQTLRVLHKVFECPSLDKDCCQEGPFLEVAKRPPSYHGPFFQEQMPSSGSFCFQITFAKRHSESKAATLLCLKHFCCAEGFGKSPTDPESVLIKHLHQKNNFKNDKPFQFEKNLASKSLYGNARHKECLFTHSDQTISTQVPRISPWTRSIFFEQCPSV